MLSSSFNFSIASSLPLGHGDYKAKIQKFIDETKDVASKDRYKFLYDADIESFYGTDSPNYVPESLK